MEPEAWGAGFSGSPVIGVTDTLDRFTLFLIPVGSGRMGRLRLRASTDLDRAEGWLYLGHPLAIRLP
jgi:hypothetical protein